MSVVAVSCVVSSLLFVAWCRCMSRRAPLLFAASCSVGALEVVKINLSVKNQHCRDGGIYPVHACIHNIKATTTHTAARAHLVSCFIVMLRVLSTASERFRFRHLTLMNANSHFLTKQFAAQRHCLHHRNSNHQRTTIWQSSLLRTRCSNTTFLQFRRINSVHATRRVPPALRAVWHLRIAADISRC